MLDPIARRSAPPPSRLETWLARTIRGGGLKTLPRYFPMGDPNGQAPEHYARVLLASLRSAAGDLHRIERLKDDGRAFRSWAELAYSPVGHGAAV